MINQQRVIAFIPLRGGSKSIKDKNLALLGGKPLCAWPIEIALQTPEIDRVIVSTDSAKIAQIAIEYGAEVQMRPEELATDTACVADVIRYARKVFAQENEPAKYMVLLEATSPFRSVEVVQKCLHRLEREKLDSIATFHEAELNPHRAWSIDQGSPAPFIKGAIPWLPRQKLPKAYQLNGVVYAFNLLALPNDTPSVLFGRMGAEIIDNDSAIDIDTKKDLVIANVIFNTRKSPETI